MAYDNFTRSLVRSYLLAAIDGDSREERINADLLAAAGIDADAIWDGYSAGSITL